MLGKHPDGDEEAMLPFMIVMMHAAVMNHLRAADQFFGFSISSGETDQGSAWLVLRAEYSCCWTYI